MKGGTSKAVWEDLTGSTALNFVNNCITFTTTVSARFWLLDCRQVTEAPKLAAILYQHAIAVPFLVKFVVYAKRRSQTEFELRLFALTDDKEEKTLESQERFVEVAKSKLVEVLQYSVCYVEFAGNLHPLASSAQQLQLRFEAFKENRLACRIKLKDTSGDLSGRIAFMREQRKQRHELPQQPICNLSIRLPEEHVQDDHSRDSPADYPQPHISYPYSHGDEDGHDDHGRFDDNGDRHKFDHHDPHSFGSRPDSADRPSNGLGADREAQPHASAEPEMNGMNDWHRPPVTETNHEYAEQLLAEHQLQSPADTSTNLLLTSSGDEPQLVAQQLSTVASECAPAQQQHVQLRPEFQQLAQQVASKWQPLAEALHLPCSIVEQLQLDRQSNDCERAEQVLHYWQLETTGDESELQQALTLIGFYERTNNHAESAPVAAPEEGDDHRYDDELKPIVLDPEVAQYTREQQPESAEDKADHVLKDEVQVLTPSLAQPDAASRHPVNQNAPPASGRSGKRSRRRKR